MMEEVIVTHSDHDRKWIQCAIMKSINTHGLKRSRHVRSHEEPASKQSSITATSAFNKIAWGYFDRLTKI